MASTSATWVALLHGPDQPGLVARLAGWIFERGGNIIHADQHRDMEEGIFFQRIEWTAAGADASCEAREFAAYATRLNMRARVASSAERPRVALMVSKAAHCFHDLILRWKSGELHGDLVGVMSNHSDLGAATRDYGLPFACVPMVAEERATCEDRQLQWLRDRGANLVVLARYMQILSPRFLESVECPVINIHHSFLPAFAGGRPYHQAHARGVKLIGATAHYATAVLDDGPIIAQDVVRITHRHNVEDLVQKGRHLETRVLAQAVQWQLENRVLVYGNKTVVFD